MPKSSIPANPWDVATNFADVVEKGPPTSTYDKGENLVRFITGRAKTFAVTKEVREKMASYPLVASDAISTQGALTLTKLIESRFLKFIMLTIKNDPSISQGHGMDDYLSRFRGDKGFLEMDDSAFLLNMFGWEGDPRVFLKECVSQVAEMEMMEGGPLFEELGPKTGGKSEPYENVAKKYNQAFPTVLTLKIQIAKEKVDVTMAVKCILHYVKSEEAIENIVYFMRKGTFLSRLMQWRSGEIKFWKHVVLRADEAKRLWHGRQTGVKKGPLDSMYWKAREGGRLKMLKGDKFGFLPTATLALTDSEAVILKESYGMNLFNGRFANHLLEKLGIISIMIVDEARNLLRIFDSGNKTYDTVTLDEDEAEKELNRSIGSALSPKRLS